MKRLALLALLAPPLFAHDMWLEPARFSGPPGAPVELRLFIGEKFRPQEERGLGLDRVSRYQIFDGGITKNPGAAITFPKGSAVVVMERIPAFIEMEREKFESYLVEEGHVQNVVGDRSVRERYTHHFKTIFSGGDTADKNYGHEFDLVLELIPRTDPRKIKPGSPFDLVVLFEGKPLPNARVAAYQKSGEETITRTDQRGRVRFAIDQRGPVLVRTTLLRPCRGCADADYESFWSALTFEVP